MENEDNIKIPDEVRASTENRYKHPRQLPNNTSKTSNTTQAFQTNR